MDARAGGEMMAIAPGQVALSDRRTKRGWSVELAPYQLAAFPITQARYDEPWSCRASVRRRSHPTFQIDDVGFRVARTPGATPCRGGRARWG